MTLKGQLKKIVLGLTIPQEYICLERAAVQNPISVFLLVNTKSFRLDVTSSHLFLGYRPLIIGLPFSSIDSNCEMVENQNQIVLSFENESIEPTTLARLVLKKIGKKMVGENTILFYEGKRGTHLFLTTTYQWINRMHEKLRARSPNNINLPGNLIDQVRIAYCIPRTISIITVSDGTLINLFPTDLHGPIGERFYAGSLRMGGLANDQIEKYGQIVISEVEPSFYKQAYTMGKNHMKELKTENEFELADARSDNFNLPLPKAATAYRELKRVTSFDYGIHRIHIYEAIHRQIVQKNKPSLSHIHCYYAQWRKDRGLETKFLFR